MLQKLTRDPQQIGSVYDLHDIRRHSSLSVVLYHDQRPLPLQTLQHQQPRRRPR